MRKKLTMFAAGFSAMLIGGMATAQIGVFDAPPDPVAAEIVEIEEPTATTTSISEPEETTTTTPSELEALPTPEPEQATTPTADSPDVVAPEIEILHPVEGQRFETKEVVFEGVAEPGSNVFAGEYEADMDDDGGWRIVLWLQPGQNTATLKAIDDAGNVGSDSITVFFDKEADEPKDESKDEPKDEIADKPVDFTIDQLYGSCSDPVPYDIFVGTGRRGLVVEASSPYGSARTELRQSGEWDLKIIFNGAPPGETFKVVVETSDGDRQVFNFTWTPGEAD